MQGLIPILFLLHTLVDILEHKRLSGVCGGILQYRLEKDTVVLTPKCSSVLSLLSFRCLLAFIFLCFLRDKFIEVSIDVFADDVAVCSVSRVYLFPRRFDARSVA